MLVCLIFIFLVFVQGLRLCVLVGQILWVWAILCRGNRDRGRPPAAAPTPRPDGAAAHCDFMAWRGQLEKGGRRCVDECDVV